MSFIWVEVVDAINTASSFLSLNATEGLSIGFDLSNLEIFRECEIYTASHAYPRPYPYFPLEMRNFHTFLKIFYSWKISI